MKLCVKMSVRKVNAAAKKCFFCVETRAVNPLDYASLLCSTVISSGGKYLSLSLFNFSPLSKVNEHFHPFLTEVFPPSNFQALHFIAVRILKRERN